MYPSPLSFLPNRWSTSQNPGSTSTTTTTTTTPSPLLTTTRAYAPFSTGPYNCIGKNLALMDIRMVIVRLLAEFPVIAFAEGEDGGELFGGLVERFTVAPGGLRLVFRR
ncbi:MAG: cytochrome P450 [Janthinobacterium lividum]